MRALLALVASLWRWLRKAFSRKPKFNSVTLRAEMERWSRLNALSFEVDRARNFALKTEHQRGATSQEAADARYLLETASEAYARALKEA